MLLHLKDTECHLSVTWDHSGTYHPTQMNTSCLNPKQTDIPHLSEG